MNTKPVWSFALSTSDISENDDKELWREFWELFGAVKNPPLYKKTDSITATQKENLIEKINKNKEWHSKVVEFDVISYPQRAPYSR